MGVLYPGEMKAIHRMVDDPIHCFPVARTSSRLFRLSMSLHILSIVRYVEVNDGKQSDPG